MTPIFAAWQRSDADRAMTAALPSRIDGTSFADAYDMARHLDGGDHWFDGRFWRGPRPVASATEGDVIADAMLAEIKRMLISKNVVKEVIDRHVSGVVGRELAFRLTPVRPLADGEEPLPAEQALIAEGEAALTAWWDAGDIPSVIRQAARTALLAGLGPLRLFIPQGLVVGGRAQAPTVEDALRLLVLEAPEPTACVLVTDADTRQRALITRITRTNGSQFLELAYLDGVQRIIRRIGDDAAFDPLPIGVLPGAMLSRPALITPQVVSSQCLLNLALTMLGRNVTTAGFVEQVILNAQRPTLRQPKSDGSGEYEDVDAAYQRGAGTVNFLTGLPIYDVDASGQVYLKGYTTPGVQWRQPVEVTSFTATRTEAYTAMLEEVHQAHALIAGDATATGVSRQQARADFESDLLLTAQTVQPALRHLLTAALRTAACIASQPGRYDGLRIETTVQTSTGPLTADEQDAVRNNVDAHLLSIETGMALLGVADVDAEQARIAAERQAAQQASGMAALQDLLSGRSQAFAQQRMIGQPQNGNGAQTEEREQ